MTDPAALTDEELAQITAKAEGSMVLSSGWAREYSVDVPRLIASLRASRAEVERLREQGRTGDLTDPVSGEVLT